MNQICYYNTKRKEIEGEREGEREGGGRELRRKGMAGKEKREDRGAGERKGREWGGRKIKYYYNRTCIMYIPLMKHPVYGIGIVMFC